MRISDGMTTRQNLRALAVSQKRLAKAQTRASSQGALNRPSDSPEATARALRTRARIGALAEYQSKLGDAADQLDSLDLSLNGVLGMVSRLKDIAEGADNAARTSDDLRAMSAEASLIAGDLIDEGNIQAAGRYVYSGDAPWVKPFDTGATGTIQYQGNQSAAQMQLDSGISISVGVTGQDVFMDPAVYGGESLFSVAQDLASALTSGDRQGIHNALAPLERAEAHVTQVRAGTGSVRARLAEGEGLNQRLATESLIAKDELSNLEEIDFAEAASELSAHETIYQAALAVTSRVAQRRSLIDFMK